MENGKAIFNVNEIISKALIGKDVLNQKEIDKIMLELDGTPNKNNLGGNSMIGVSIACAKAAAKVIGQEVYQYLQTLAEIKPSRKAPYLFMNLLEGGKHAGSALAFQEYLIVSDTENISEAVGIGIKIQDTLRKIISRDLGEESLVLGDEGGFALKIADVRKPLVFLTEAIRQNNLQDKVRLALDAAASSFYEPVRASGDGIYKIGGKDISKKELMDLYESLIDEFNLFSIEDPFNEEDFESFRELKEKNRNSLIVGDDLTVSNKTLL
ncbi:MAG: Enolase, partial [Candidatus Nomurabacteria bacterium GW2011_GWA2_41_25]